MSKRSMPIILMADDDDDDRFLVQEACTEAELNIKVCFVKDGQELLDYLNKDGDYFKGKNAPKPELILLDLNMPRKDGREALSEIKANPNIRSIPIVIFTTSNAEEDIQYAYKLGVSSYITKPTTFDGLVETMKVLGEYWFNITRIPRSN